MTQVGDTLFFSAFTSAAGEELFKFAAGDLAPTLIDVMPGIAGSSPGDLTDVAGELFFMANTVAAGRELYRIEADSAAATMIDVNQLTLFELLSNRSLRALTGCCREIRLCDFARVCGAVTRVGCAVAPWRL